MNVCKIQVEKTESPSSQRRKIPSRVVVRNRNTLPPRISTIDIQTTAATPARTTTSLNEIPKTTRRVLKRKLFSRTPPLTRRQPQVITTSIPETTTTATTTKITTTTLPPESVNYSSENFDDEEISSILPALTSVRPRKTPAPIFIDPATRSLKTFPPPPIQLVETSTLRPTTTFDQILEHQYKIKGLDKDFEEEKLERYANHQEEDDKLIGVLGSQVIIA